MDDAEAFNASMKAFADSVEKALSALSEELVDLRRELTELGVLPPEEE